jgi:hypothetical protein
MPSGSDGSMASDEGPPSPLAIRLSPRRPEHPMHVTNDPLALAVGYCTGVTAPANFHCVV